MSDGAITSAPAFANETDCDANVSKVKSLSTSPLIIVPQCP